MFAVFINLTYSFWLFWTPFWFLMTFGIMYMAYKFSRRALDNKLAKRAEELYLKVFGINKSYFEDFDLIVHIGLYSAWIDISRITTEEKKSENIEFEKEMMNRSMMMDADLIDEVQQGQNLMANQPSLTLFPPGGTTPNTMAPPQTQMQIPDLTFGGAETHGDLAPRITLDTSTKKKKSGGWFQSEMTASYFFPTTAGNRFTPNQSPEKIYVEGEELQASEANSPTPLRVTLDVTDQRGFKKSSGGLNVPGRRDRITVSPPSMENIKEEPEDGGLISNLVAVMVDSDEEISCKDLRTEVGAGKGADVVVEGKVLDES
jgi:hypothetical protein